MLCSQNQRLPRVRERRPGQGRPCLGAGGTEVTPITGLRSDPGNVRLRGSARGCSVS